MSKFVFLNFRIHPREIIDDGELVRDVELENNFNDELKSKNKNYIVLFTQQDQISPDKLGDTFEVLRDNHSYNRSSRADLEDLEKSTSRLKINMIIDMKFCLKN